MMADRIFSLAETRSAAVWTQVHLDLMTKAVDHIRAACGTWRINGVLRILQLVLYLSIQDESKHPSVPLKISHFLCAEDGPRRVSLDSAALCKLERSRISAANRVRAFMRRLPDAGPAPAPGDAPLLPPVDDAPPPDCEPGSAAPNNNTGAYGRQPPSWCGEDPSSRGGGGRDLSAPGGSRLRAEAPATGTCSPPNEQSSADPDPSSAPMTSNAAIAKNSSTQDVPALEADRLSPSASSGDISKLDREAPAGDSLAKVRLD